MPKLMMTLICIMKIEYTNDNLVNGLLPVDGNIVDTTLRKSIRNTRLPAYLQDFETNIDAILPLRLYIRIKRSLSYSLDQELIIPISSLRTPLFVISKEKSSFGTTLTMETLSISQEIK